MCAVLLAFFVCGVAVKVFSSSQQRSLYTSGEPTQTRQRLFGDIAPIYDEVGRTFGKCLHELS